VVLGGIHDRDISSFQRLARGVETIVQLLCDAETAGACPCTGFQSVMDEQRGN
jgi:hypothetical protein